MGSATVGGSPLAGTIPTTSAPTTTRIRSSRGSHLRHAMGLQGSVFHGSLRFLRHEPTDALFGVPSDWSLARRMLRIGVRVGYLDQVVCDYYPSYRAAAEAG